MPSLTVWGDDEESLRLLELLALRFGLFVDTTAPPKKSNIDLATIPLSNFVDESDLQLLRESNLLTLHDLSFVRFERFVDVLGYCVNKHILAAMVKYGAVFSDANPVAMVYDLDDTSGLSTRAYNSLARRNLHSTQMLAHLSALFVRDIPMIGRKTYTELRLYLRDKHGVTFKVDS